MSHAVLSITITCGLSHIFFYRQRQRHAILFNGIAEQNLNSILIGSAATRCRDRNRCASSSVTYDIAVVITEVNSFAIPFGVDFKLIAVSEHKRFIFSCSSGGLPFRIKLVCIGSDIKIATNIRPHAVSLLSCDFAVCKPTTFAILSINLSIHIRCHVFHTSRQTGHPLGIGLTVKLNTCRISSNARIGKALLQLVLYGQVIVHFIFTFFHRRDGNSNFCRDSIVKCIIGEFAFICTICNQFFFGCSNIVVVIDSDYTAVGSVSVILIDSMSVGIRSCSLNSFPAIGRKSILTLLALFGFCRLYGDIVCRAFGKNKFIVFIQRCRSMFVTLVSRNNDIAIHVCCGDFESFKRIVAGIELDVDVAGVCSDCSHCIGNCAIQLNTRPRSVRIVCQCLGRSFILVQITVCGRLCIAVIVLHHIHIIIGILRLNEPLVPLIMEIDVITIYVSIESDFIANLGLDLTFGRIVSQTDSHKITFINVRSFRCFRNFCRLRRSRRIRSFGGFRSGCWNLGGLRSRLRF